MAGTRCRRRPARITTSCSAPGARQPVLLQGWIQRDVAVDLFRRAGLDFEAVKRQARSRRLPPDRPRRDLLGRPAGDGRAGREPQRHRPPRRRAAPGRDDHVLRPLGRLRHRPAPTRAATRSATAPMTTRSGSPACSRSPATSPPGRGPSAPCSSPPGPAEERGLLGSEYYAANPLYPAETMVANLTLDTLQTAGPARDVILIGQGQSEPRGPDGARRRGARAATVTPDAQPQRGLFYRADHFPLAKRGVPVLLLMALGGGVDLVERRPRGGRPLGQRVHRPLLPPDLRRMAPGLGSARRRAGRRLGLPRSAASSPTAATGRNGARARNSAQSGNVRRTGAASKAASILLAMHGQNVDDMLYHNCGDAA